jgi:hypothetical protein
MKKFMAVFLFSLITGAVYGQNILIRPNASAGYFHGDGKKGLSCDYGAKILLAANKSQRYGIKIDHLNVFHDDNAKSSYVGAGLFIEQVILKYFNMGIGTVGYINVTSPGSNPFGIYSHLGFEYPLAKHFSILAAYQSEIIFSGGVAANNAFMLGLGLHL